MKWAAIFITSILLLLIAAPGWADTITDPSDLHVGTGAGSLCAEGCAGDPNVINMTGFSLYYNSNGSGQLPIGNPFYLIMAVPIFSGDGYNQAGSDSVSMTSPATWYQNYKTNGTGATQTSVSVGLTPSFAGTLTSSAGKDVYKVVAPTISQEDASFNFVNMQSCDLGTSGGSNKCPNASVQNNGPLAGKTITGFDIWTFTIGTSNFSPGDLLNFVGSAPVGTYVTALGVNGTQGWDVPFTESGLVPVGGGGTPKSPVPEPNTLLLLVSGLAGLGAWTRRRLTT